MLPGLNRFEAKDIAMAHQQELEVAVQAVARACALCTTVQRTLVSAETLAKKDKSPVTVADYGVQAVVTAELIASFPATPMVGEEDAGHLRDPQGAAVRERVCAAVREINPKLNDANILAAIDFGTHTGGADGRHWALDPIDGTKGFLRGDQYAIALGLIENGEVVLGVLGCPNLGDAPDAPESARGRVFFARRGGGAFVRAINHPQARPIQVTDMADPVQANFCESVESGHTDQGASAAIARHLGVTAPPFRIDSQCKYAAIARGDSSIYLRMPTRADYEEKIWDHAAGSIIVTEAGGTVSDIDGKSLDFSLGRTLRANRGVVATNGKLHEKVIAAIAASETESRP
jgi:3'(2'), 5'-bisphosphate nucleotidase